MRDFKIEIPDDQVTIVFNAFDLNRDGTISYDEFLRMIRGDLNTFRLALVKKAFTKLDSDGCGIVDINHIRNLYNASRHPDVMSGKKTEEAILTEFLETFETHHNIMHGQQADGRITVDEFVEYYTNVSSSIDLDEYFALVMNNSWNLTGDAVTYKKYQKGEAFKDMSPARNNAYVGDPHTGYQQGKNSVKMV